MVEMPGHRRMVLIVEMPKFLDNFQMIPCLVQEYVGAS
jgi:hypothetical protein